MKKRYISGAEAREVYSLTHMELFNAVKNGLTPHDEFGRQAPSYSEFLGNEVCRILKIIYPETHGRQPTKEELADHKKNTYKKY